MTILTLKQAAEYLHLHPETVRQRAKCGQDVLAPISAR